MRSSKKNNMIRMKSTTISCLYSISLWDDCPHHSDYSEKYPSLSTVPGRGSVNFICFKYPQNVSWEHHNSRSLSRVDAFFFNEIYFPMEAGLIRPTKAGVHPPKFTQKHGHKCNGMFGVSLFIRSTHSPTLYVWTPRWWYTVSQMMIFFNTNLALFKWS